ncbi:MAG: nucleoid-associated protein, YbaB/EbfC family [Deltaproteobacteria bacterium RIFCSPHIGHO2_02_FULL_40_11]|nr:MAG: nucleoid-associated protein, YbaB/EbfC family [Deltaproteobacteria bacterium RIFCSPHIGHO2_02_FULL_40_11]
MSKLFGGMGNMLKQAQKMQAEMKKIQEGLAQKTVEASSGGGMVKVVANGKQEIISIQIEPEVLKEDKSMVEDLVTAAVNEAIQESQKMVQNEMGRLTGGLNIPGLF